MSSVTSRENFPDRGFTPRRIKITLICLGVLTAGTWAGSRFLMGGNFLPHWYCYAGNQRLLWTNVIADVFIAVSYLMISLTLVRLVWRAQRTLPYRLFFWAFGAFIVSCAATHTIEVITIWNPVYWLLAAMKIVTALSSVGTAVVLVIAAPDISKFFRSAREVAARSGNQRFRSLIQAVPMAVISLNLRGKITAWNPGAERLFGWKAEEILRKPKPTVPPEKLLEEEMLWSRTLAGHETQGLETVRLNRNGKRISVTISTAPVFDDNGIISGVMGVFEDTGKRQRITRQLSEKTAMLSTVTEALNAYLDTGNWNIASGQLLSFAIQLSQSELGFLGVVLEGPVLRILSHDGIVRDIDIKEKILTGTPSEVTAEENGEILNLDKLFAQVIAKRGIVIANQPHQAIPPPNPVVAGEQMLHAFLGVPIFKGAEVVGLLGLANRSGGYTGREVQSLETMFQTTGILCHSFRQSLKRTALELQRERLEDQFRQAQKMEVLGRLAGGVAHDFNNILMILSGSAELLQSALPKGAPGARFVDQILRTTEKAASITRQLLAFSRKQVLNIHPVDLHEVLTESEFMLPRLLGSDIELKFHPQAANSWILSDSSQIEQAVANLAINARDAMTGGGKLIISTRNAASLPEPEMDSAAAPPAKGWVVLAVADNGFGMDEKIRKQIFEPFFTTKPEGKGTGLGLASVYGIVRQGGGHIYVDSTPGVGTKFELYFPAVEALPHELVAEPAIAQEETLTGTVLVVDDRPALRRSIVEILNASGYTALEASSSLDALEIARWQGAVIDVLLTDIVMPGLRGPELARQVAALHPKVQIIFMSGYAEGLPEAQLPEGSVFLQKPFQFAMLLEQIKLLLQRA